MLSNNGDDFGFDDMSYQDNYENATVDSNMFESAEDLFEGSTTDLFGQSEQTSSDDMFAQPQMDMQNQMYQQPMNNQGYQQQAQQMSQGSAMMNNLRKQAGNIVENGGVNLNKKQSGLILLGAGFIILLICFGIHSLVTRPKASEQPTVQQQQVTEPIQAPTQQQQPVTQPIAQTKSVSDVNTLNLIVVGDDVPIDYTSAEITATGLVTGKTTYVIDNQVIYCLDISMTVGSDTRRIRHFCNRKLFTGLEQGTVVEVHYQQVDDNNIAVFDITM